MRAAWLLLLAAGCGALPHSKAAGSVGALTVRSVAWNPTSANVGKVRAVAEAGDVLCVVGDQGATIFSAKAVVSHDDRAKSFTSTTAVRATDSDASWIVGIDGEGRIQRLRGMTDFEDASARYGLDGKKVHSATMVGPQAVGFLLDGAIAVSTSKGTSKLAGSSYVQLAGGGGFAAGLVRDGVDRINLANGYVTHFPLEGAAAVAVGPSGELAAITRRAVYVGGESDLALVYDAGAETIHSISASGTHFWFGDGTELGLLENGRVTETSGLGIDASAVVQGTADGGAWVIGGGKLARYEVPSAAHVDDAWASTIAPVFARSCSACHQPNGAAGIDLSTKAAWDGEKAMIRDRVVVKKTMPPKDHPLSDADRAAIEAWLTK